MTFHRPAKRISKIILTLLVFLFLELIHMDSAFVYACQPAGDQLFSEIYDLDLSKLPRQVDMITSNGMRQIQNRTENPITLVSEKLFHLIKINPNLLLRPQDHPHRPIIFIPPGSVYELGSRQLQALDSNTDRSINPYVYNKPNPIYVPPQQPSRFYLAIGEEWVEIPFTISYEVNKDFHVGGCGLGYALTPLLLMCLAGGGIIGVVFVGFKLLKYRNQIFPN